MTERLGRVLAGWIAALAVLHVAAVTLTEGLGNDGFDRFEAWFSMNREQNVPTAFSTLLIVAAAVVAAGIARVLRRDGRPHVFAWVVLSLAMLGLALDEWVQIHEKVGGAIHDRLDLAGPLRFPWVLPYAVLAVSLVVVVSPMLRGLDGLTLRRFVVAGAIYVGGAAGMEMIGAAWFDANGEEVDYPYLLLATIEESLEMVGMAMFVLAALAHLRTRSRESSAPEMVDLNRG